MSASRQEIAELSDKICELLGVRVANGTLTLHYHAGVLQRVETGNVFRLEKAGDSGNLLDRPGRSRPP